VGILDGISRALESRTPPTNARILVALAIAMASAAFAASQFVHGRPHSDFGMLWYAARTLLHGQDPYSVIGPGKEFNYDWPLIYPNTAVVAVLPFTLLSERWATAAFTGLSSWLLAFGITRDGWYRIPLFASVAYISAAQLGQWSMLFTAALFLPFLTFFSAAKPQDALYVLAAAVSRRSYKFAALGTAVLLALAFALYPQWLFTWFGAISRTSGMEPLIIRMGGPLVLLVLLRWRRPESWLVLTLAALPRSWGWYNTLPLFAVPRSFGESVFLAGTTMFGAWYADNFLDPTTAGGLIASVGNVIVLTMYLPVTLMILRKKNEGPPPVWLQPFRARQPNALDARIGP
jgi:hypothetical protein